MLNLDIEMIGWGGIDSLKPLDPRHVLMEMLQKIESQREETFVAMWYVCAHDCRLEAQDFLVQSCSPFITVPSYCYTQHKVTIRTM